MTVTEQTKNESLIQDLVLYVQPVCKVKTVDDVTVSDYEILMRSKTEKRFPAETLRTLISSELGNQLLLTWKINELKKIIAVYPEYGVDVNLDTIQFKYSYTWEYLKQLKELSDNITVEITERIVNFSTSNFDFRAILKRIQAIGLKIALDDVGAGQSSIKLILDNADCFYRIKFSLLMFRNECQEVKESFVKAFKLLADCKKFEFVIEAIEDESQVQNCIDHGCVLQQGYYWRKPHAVGA